MSGIDAVIARVGDIETYITKLDPTAKTDQTAAADKAPETNEVAATKFADVLNAAKDSEDPGTATTGVQTKTTEKTAAANAELVAAMQALFSSKTSGESSSASTLKTLAGLLG